MQSRAAAGFPGRPGQAMTSRPPPLRRLIADLHAVSTRFAELWATGAVGTHQTARKTIRHPDVGPSPTPRRPGAKPWRN